VNKAIGKKRVISTAIYDALIMPILIRHRATLACSEIIIIIPGPACVKVGPHFSRQSYMTLLLSIHFVISFLHGGRSSTTV